MSLVERALQKLQSNRPAAATKAEPTWQPPAKEAQGARAHTSPEQHVPASPRPEPAMPSPEDFRANSAKLLHIDRERLRNLSMIPPAAQQRELSNQFRSIKRPIIDHALEIAADEPFARTVMIASALPGDGKTFTCLNLALSLALEKDLHVLLVDADAPKPHLSRTFEMQRSLGLLDVLADPDRPIESVIVPTDVPRLDFLPAGTTSETATELLASERMRTVVQRLTSLYRHGIILFDSPPVLLTNESRTLGALLGQIVLVVKAGVTPQQAVKDAVGMLGEDRRISLVLNNADLGGAMGYYYGYGYGYGSYAAPDGDKPSDTNAPSSG
jgi:exopolysaccharide/PEP-CTERM locus tyrosine autokinase